jgi:hypothetical protein
LKRNLTAITENHDVQIVVAEYAEVHEQVNDIVFNLPGEEGLGTIAWEPTTWHQTLFDKGRTNDRIDLYPRLWEEYGNDTLPLLPAAVSVNREYGLSENKTPGSIRINPDGSLHYKAIMSSEMKFELFTFEGRLAAKGVFNHCGVTAIPRSVNNGTYIVKLSDGYQRFSGTVFKCAR